jgi:hypothetical protein
MEQGNRTIFVISNPHIVHYKKIVKKWIKRERNYHRYSSLFDYLYEGDRLEILRSGNFSSFRNPILNKIFSTNILNNLEFFIWLHINKLFSKRIKVYKNIDEIDTQSRVILDFAFTWGFGDKNHVLKLLTFKGIVLIHMTHYFKNTSLIFESLPKFKHPVLISEGNVIENGFFKNNVKEEIAEIRVPFVINHLMNQASKESLNISRNKKCLIMGSPNVYHYNSDLLNFYSTDFLNPDRSNFRNHAIKNNKFSFEPSNKPKTKHDFKKTISELYLGVDIFFTGSEIIGLPSINTFEGMYFGALYIGPQDQVHKSLGFVSGSNYLSYTPGDYLDFVKVVNRALSNPDSSLIISRNGQNFVIENFNAQIVYDDLVDKVDRLIANKNLDN